MTSRFRNLADMASAFFRIAVLEAFAYPASFLLGRIGQVTPILIFAFVSDAVVGDASYFAYVVIGMLVAQLLDAGINGLSGQLATEISTGRLEGYLAEPVPIWFLPFGFMQFDLLVRLGGAAVITVIAIPLGAQFNGGVKLLAAIAITLLGLLAVLSVSIVGAGLQLIAKKADVLLTVYSVGSRFFAGVLFPVSSLPGFLQPVSYLFPQTYAIQAVRSLMLDDTRFDATMEPRTAILALVVYIAIAMPVAIWVFLRAVRYGRQRGLLTGY